MNRSRNGLSEGLFTSMCGVVVVLAAVLPTAVVAGEAEAVKEFIVDRENNIYDTQAAFDLAMQARTYDPNFSSDELPDRDKAIGLYEKAIAAQPDAKLNAQLANRIAQLHAYGADSMKGLSNDPAKAREWWTRALTYTDDTQLLWAQVQMSLDDLDKVIGVEIDKVTLPDFKLWPEGTVKGRKKGDDKRAAFTADQEKAAIERETKAHETRMRMLRKSVEEIQLTAVQRKFDGLRNKNEGKDGLEFLQSMVETFKDAPAGKWAKGKIEELK